MNKYVMILMAYLAGGQLQSCIRLKFPCDACNFSAKDKNCLFQAPNIEKKCYLPPFCISSKLKYWDIKIIQLAWAFFVLKGHSN